MEYVKRATRAASTTFDDAFAPAALTRARGDMMLASASVTRVITPSRSTRRVRARAGAAFEIPASYSGVTPCGAGVLVKVAAAEAVTKGGIVLTESAQRKPTSGACARARGEGDCTRVMRLGSWTRAREGGGRVEGLTRGSATRAREGVTR